MKSLANSFTKRHTHCWTESIVQFVVRCGADGLPYNWLTTVFAEPNTPDKKEAPDALYDVPNPAAPPAPPPPPLPGQNGGGQYASSRENTTSSNKANTLPPESGHSSRASSFST